MMASEQNPELYESSAGKTHIFIGERELDSTWSTTKGPYYLCGLRKGSSDEAVTYAEDLCSNCQSSALNRGLITEDGEIVSENDDESRIDMIPEVDMFAIREGGKTWTVYEDGVKTGTVEGSKELVERIVNDE